MSDKSPPEVERQHPVPIHWGRLLYLSMLTVIGLLATFPVFNHFRIRSYERLRHEITSAGGRAPRYRGGSRSAEDIYWSALGGDLSSIVIRQVDYPPFVPVQRSILSRLRHCAELEQLHLDGQQLDDVMCREIFRTVQLEDLRLGFCELSDEQLRGIESLENLQVLDLQGTSITDASLDRLAGLANLTELDLRQTDISQAGAARLASALPEAKIRHRSWPSAAHRQAALRLFRSGALLEIKDGAAQGVRIQLMRQRWQGTAHDLEDLAQLRDVEALELRGVDLDPRVLAAIARLPNIPTVSIVSCPMRDADLSLLASSPSVRTLVLGDVFVETPVAERLAGLDRLEKLALVNVRLVPGSLATMARLGSLRELSLFNMRLRGSALGELSEATALRKLDFIRTPVNDSQVEEIRQLRDLESLGLNGTQVTDNAIDSLSTLVHLHRLDVSGTRLSSAGLDQLKAALPDCRVESKVEHPAQLDIVDFVSGRRVPPAPAGGAAAR